ncbi:adenylate cyclase [Mariprofundus micogutta]|uniref:Adenylate cyclase n=1 Tax=Mariprofundus micogutta TaxID=1921010 RepID=A0A1L8CMA2_9PROT|nr:adenylate/guanylate cyclase domain-containing protein [Mariprofundus micogutta]GAV20025.1 adenylate cyclase [Mariprofundus micogutta]
MRDIEIEPVDIQTSESDTVEQSKERFAPRIPIRWRWIMLVGITVTVAIGVLFFIILDIERSAWLESQAAQAELQVDRLTDELKLPMLSGSSAETDLVVQGFLEKVPSVMGVLLKYPDGKTKAYKDVGNENKLAKMLVVSEEVKRLSIKQLWYAKTVIYAKTAMGTIGVRFSEQAWEEIAGKLVQRILLAALVVVFLSVVAVYWLAGRMSERLELLADGAAQVAKGDFHVKLAVRGNDEISDAVSQFNVMVAELAHKQELRDVFGRYLNPKLVSDVFESGEVKVENHRQEVTVLFADMVQFTSFSESTETEAVVAVLNSHFEVFHRVIAYYGGHVDKYIGDAVMAVFNHPVGDEDHVRHAAKAGLAIAQACEKLGFKREDGSTISFRVGLNCGQAIAGNIGAAKRMEYTVIGDAVNVASRMGGLGEGGDVVMSHSSFHKLGDGFVFHPIGESEMKGVSQKIEVGTVEVSSKHVRRNIEHVVELAFNLDLPTDVRQIAGDA